MGPRDLYPRMHGKLLSYLYLNSSLWCMQDQLQWEAISLNTPRMALGTSAVFKLVAGGCRIGNDGYLESDLH
jgi:hypothetical protein